MSERLTYLDAGQRRPVSVRGKPGRLLGSRGEVLVEDRPPQRSTAPARRTLAEQSSQRTRRASRVPAPPASHEVDAGSAKPAPGPPVAEGHPASEAAAVDADAEPLAQLAVLALEVVEFLEHVVLARQEHAARMDDAADDDLGADGSGAGLREPDPEIPVAQLEQPFVESAQVPEHVRARDDVGGTAPQDVARQERRGEACRVGRVERVEPGAV